jgi:tryptophan-rich sensory protein
MNKLLLKIVICILICAGLGALSGFSTVDAINGWYQTLRKPGWNPPNSVFGPVWTVLYVLMGNSAALVWNSHHSDKKKALGIFIIQFILNLLWSFIFFGQQNIVLALADIIALWVMIVITIIYFYRINRVAAWLLFPYLLWVSFATALNFSIYILNR